MSQAEVPRQGSHCSTHTHTSCHSRAGSSPPSSRHSVWKVPGPVREHPSTSHPAQASGSVWRPFRGSTSRHRGHRAHLPPGWPRQHPVPFLPCGQGQAEGSVHCVCVCGGGDGPPTSSHSCPCSVTHLHPGTEEKPAAMEGTWQNVPTLWLLPAGPPAPCPCTWKHICSGVFLASVAGLPRATPQSCSPSPARGVMGDSGLCGPAQPWACAHGAHG